MAGTVTVTEIINRSPKVISFDWTSDASAGTATSSATTNTYTGRAVGFLTVPDSTTPPTDNYDITVTDSNSIDVLKGAGGNRDAAVVQYEDENYMGYITASTLTFNLSNAGNSKKGKAYLFIR